MEILLLVLGLLLFVGLVVVHEFGHFIMARRNSVEVEEFGIGFPPKVKTLFRDKKGTEYTLNWLPLGGFVRLKGEHDQDKEKGTFGAASFAAKAKIILAGVFMNLVTAWALFSFLALIGIPRLPLPDGVSQYTVATDTKIVSNDIFVGYVEPDGPADRAGVKPGDRIICLSHKNDLRIDRENLGCENNLYQAAELRSTTQKLLSEGNELLLIAERNGLVQNFTISSRTIAEVQESEKTDTPKGYLGVVPYDYAIQRSTWSAPIVGAGLVAQFSKLTYEALGSAVASLFQGKGGEASQNVSGPIGIFVVLRDGTSLGLPYILLIIALLSLTLAIMNTLPIPALDGGKLAVMLIFRAFKKPLTPRLEERIHGTGFMVLMALFLVITVVDIRRFF